MKSHSDGTLKAKLDIITLDSTDLRYPIALKKYLRDDTPVSIAALGDLNILQNNTLALFSSIKCPGNLILKTYDLAQSLRQQSVTVIGGFHSRMEKETLAILVRGKQPVILCPARNIGAKMTREYAEPIEQGRLLILTPFDDQQTRITAETSVVRNRFVAALAYSVFVAHADPGGKLEALCREMITWGKPVYTFDDTANENLGWLGARTVPATFPLAEQSVKDATMAEFRKRAK